MQKETEIPKRIYYVWLGKNPLPEIIQNNLKNWKKVNSDFEIIRIDESNFDINKYTYVKKAYEDKNWAFASDVVRLDVIYNNGGFYFDTDVFFVKNISNLCKYKSVWGMENSGTVNSGLIVGAHKGDTDLKNLLKIYKNKIYDKNNIDSLITTGIISNYFEQQGLRINNKRQMLDNGQLILPTEYFAPLHWWGGGKVTKNTIAIQQFLNSWGESSKVNTIVKLNLNFRLYFPELYSVLRKIKKSII